MRENDGIPFFFKAFDFCEQIKALQVFAGRWGVHAVIPLPCRTYSGSLIEGLCGRFSLMKQG
jgi:hypothetical protein